jgi:hypothetical protein
VTKEHVTEPVNRNTDGCRPAGQQIFVRRVQLLRRPAHDLSKLRRHGAGFDSLHSCQHFAIAIAVDEPQRHIESQQALNRFHRHRPGHDVAADDDLVGARPADLVEDGLERGKIPVNVVQSCNPHGRSC